MDVKNFRTRVVGRTGGGKKVTIEPVQNTNVFQIKFVPGGEVPKALSGRWTDPFAAKRAILNYFEVNNRKLETNLEEVNV